MEAERLIHGSSSINLIVQPFKPILLNNIQNAPSITDQQRADSRFSNVLSVATHFIETLCGVSRSDAGFGLPYILRKIKEYRQSIPTQVTMDTLLNLSLTRELVPEEVRMLRVFSFLIIQELYSAVCNREISATAGLRRSNRRRVECHSCR
jgi:hypothetical protein